MDRVNQRRCLEESGQRLENVDQTHLVLASGKLVLHKNLWMFLGPNPDPLALQDNALSISPKLGKNRLHEKLFS